MRMIGAAVLDAPALDDPGLEQDRIDAIEIVKRREPKTARCD